MGLLESVGQVGEQIKIVIFEQDPRCQERFGQDAERNGFPFCLGLGAVGSDALGQTLLGCENHQGVGEAAHGRLQPDRIRCVEGRPDQLEARLGRLADFERAGREQLLAVLPDPFGVHSQDLGVDQPFEPDPPGLVEMVGQPGVDLRTLFLGEMPGLPGHQACLPGVSSRRRPRRARPAARSVGIGTSDRARRRSD
ncbi:hypothetical protein [Microlunatus endophyticus]|uniref:hypothetical protein n=1 Tax=Microlunatus endophyticus TaxID=1716077 RepID=UPI001664AC0C|nr:hypothetical protein [Microlunatus endophyticus]